MEMENAVKNTVFFYRGQAAAGGNRNDTVVREKDDCASALPVFQ